LEGFSSGQVLKWFTPLREVEPELEEEVTQVPVAKLKEFALEAISKKKKAWLSLDTFENISNDINRCESHKDIITYVNKGLK
jgi:hypothetical protein